MFRVGDAAREKTAEKFYKLGVFLVHTLLRSKPGRQHRKKATSMTLVRIKMQYLSGFVRLSTAVHCATCCLHPLTETVCSGMCGLSLEAQNPWLQARCMFARWLELGSLFEHGETRFQRALGVS